MANVPSLVEMLEAGVHFGHRTSRWHPKMDKYIFGARGGFHVIDLEVTQKELEKALDAVKGIVSRGGTVLFVGTKEQSKGLVEKYAKACNMPYVIERWLGGTITNFNQVKRTLKRLKTLRDQRDKGELRKYTKKEQILIGREIEEMETKVGGIVDMERIPEAIFVLDIRVDKTAVMEAKTVGVKVVGICDTNVNPEIVDYAIPANDDAVNSVEMMCRLASDAVKSGAAEAMQKRAAKKQEAPKKKATSKKETKEEK